MRRKLLVFGWILMMLFTVPYKAGAAQVPLREETRETAEIPELGITAVSCILMEESTGTILYAKNETEQLSPASITKIMTLLLIFEEMEKGTLQPEDPVTVSAYAASMGGSQVFLEEGETQSAETMMKCISVASANDASVAMAEKIAGSEMEFVNRMNEKVKLLGMTGTHFEDCCGLSDSDGHYTTAKDVAIMSRELVSKYPQIHEYSTIWMDTITHRTRRGESEFGLSNTNKLVKQYPYTTGLKTGSTSKAKYCVSATAEKDGVELIAVIMAAPDYKVRFSEAQTLLEYGFSRCRIYEKTKEELEPLPLVPVKRGKEKEAVLEYEKDFAYLSTKGEDFSGISISYEMPEWLTAPMEKGSAVGKVRFSQGEETIGEVRVLLGQDLEKAGFLDCMKEIRDWFVL